MQPRTFRNFQPNDHIRTKKERSLKSRNDSQYSARDALVTLLVIKFQENTMLTIKSQRGIWEMSLKEINTKFVNHEIDEVTYKNGQWK